MADDIDVIPHSHATSQGPSQLSPITSSPSESTNNEPNVLWQASPKSPQIIPVLSSDSSKKSTAIDSQPMTTAVSTPTSIPSVQPTNAMDMTGPSPYGTRSRNRNGNTRPNYAEDRELDTDYDLNSAKKSQASLGTATSNYPHSGESNQFSSVNTRRSSITGSGTGTGKSTGTNTTPKDYIPGMSTFSLNLDVSPAHQPPSKKRKAPGGVAAAPNTTLNLLPTTVYRRTGWTAATSGLRETNMLSFELCQGYLKNGKLKADDGTLLGINGMCKPNG